MIMDGFMRFHGEINEMSAGWIRWWSFHVAASAIGLVLRSVKHQAGTKPKQVIPYIVWINKSYVTHVHNLK